jgi:hypothetical protein
VVLLVVRLTDQIQLVLDKDVVIPVLQAQIQHILALAQLAIQLVAQIQDQMLVIDVDHVHKAEEQHTVHVDQRPITQFVLLALAELQVLLDIIVQLETGNVDVFSLLDILIQ